MNTKSFVKTFTIFLALVAAATSIQSATLTATNNDTQTVQVNDEVTNLVFVALP